MHAENAMDTTIIDLERMRKVSQQQRDSAAAMFAEAKRMSERAGRMLTNVMATRSKLAEQWPHVVWLPAA
jgi:hypothetical protein